MDRAVVKAITIPSASARSVLINAITMVAVAAVSSDLRRCSRTLVFS